MLPYGVDEAIGGDGDGGEDAPSPPPPPPPPPPDAPPPPLSPLERARVFLAAVAADPGRFDGHATPGLRAAAYDPRRARLRCEMPLSRAVTNRYGGLHGGCAATLVDVAATAALAAGGDRAGVSLSIAAHYHRPVVPLGAAGGAVSTGRAGGLGGGSGGRGGGTGGGTGGGNAPPFAPKYDDDDDGSRTIVVVDAEVVKVGKHVAAVDVAIRTRRTGAGKARRRPQGRGDGDEDEDGGNGDEGGGSKQDQDGPVLVSGTHVKALVARSDVGALFDRAGGRSRL